MRFIKHILSDILKRLDIHECHRMYHSHLSIHSCQLAAPFDKAGIEVGVEFIRLFVVSLHESLQFLAEVGTVGIRRIGHHHVVFLADDVEEGLCLRRLQEREGVCLAPFVHEVVNDSLHLVATIEQRIHLFGREQRVVVVVRGKFVQLLFHPYQRAKLMRRR